MIAIIDYGMGNLQSVVNALAALKQDVLITASPEHIKTASAIILPGVGAFGDGMRNLRERGLVEPLTEQILGRGKPYLGICLGLQFLAEEGEEGGLHQGLGWIKGRVVRIKPEDKKLKIPHMGWNSVKIERPCKLYDSLSDQPVFYFVHSYHFEPNAESQEVITGTCWYGMHVTASLQYRNIFGVQFHPEKSQENGMALLENFIKQIPC